MKGLIIFISIFIPFVMNGKTFFTEGMKWSTQIIGTHDPNPKASIEEVTIEKSADKDCLVMYRSSSIDVPAKRELVASVRTEGDKVFFKPGSDENSEWYLLYDFGMKSGEGCFVYSPIVTSENSIPYKTYIKCVGINESSEYDGWTTMSLEEYVDDTCSDLHGQGTWIKGLSSLNGVLYNNRFGVDGVGTKLLWEVYQDGNVIFSAKSADVQEISGSSTPNIRIDGLKVYISVNDEICGSLYSQNGVHIGDYKFGKASTCISVPTPGVYILRIGDTTRKVLVP